MLGVTIPKPFGFDKSPDHQNTKLLRESTTFSSKGPFSSSVGRSLTDFGLHKSGTQSRFSKADPSVFSGGGNSEAVLSRISARTGRPVNQRLEENLKELEQERQQEIKSRTKFEGEDDIRYLHKKLKAIKIYTTPFN